VSVFPCGDVCTEVGIEMWWLAACESYTDPTAGATEPTTVIPTTVINLPVRFEVAPPDEDSRSTLSGCQATSRPYYLQECPQS
jgi:hypothetical protein